MAFRREYVRFVFVSRPAALSSAAPYQQNIFLVLPAASILQYFFLGIGASELVLTGVIGGWAWACSTTSIADRRRIVEHAVTVKSPPSPVLVPRTHTALAPAARAAPSKKTSSARSWSPSGSSTPRPCSSSACAAASRHCAASRRSVERRRGSPSPRRGRCRRPCPSSARGRDDHSPPPT